MVKVKDNFIVGNTAPNVGYEGLKPWIHESGAPRWRIDEIGFTHIVEGHKIRLQTQLELESDPLYSTWIIEKQAQDKQNQAKVDFLTLPVWIKTGTLLQAEDYIETFVVDLASAKTIQKQMAKIFVLLRDYVRIK